MPSAQTQEIPKEAYAVIFAKNNGPLEYKKVPVPKPASDEVLVNIKYSGVCHTDLHAWKGDWPLDTKPNLIGGHEGAGIVAAVGDLVDDVKVGDRVGVKWLNGSCLSCVHCRQSDEPLCKKALLSGYTVDGTFAQYCIGKAAHVAKIPDGVDLAAVAPILCAGITVYKALKESGARAGQEVAISGAGGGLGSLACQYAKAMGFRVIGIDGGDDKRDMCVNNLGVEHFIDFTKSKDIVADVKAASQDGEGPQAVILVAVSEKPFEQAAQYVRPRGTVVAVGLPPGAQIKADVFATVINMTTIKGSYVGNRQDTQEALEFFRRGVISAPYKVVPLKELEDVYKKMEAGQIAGRYVLDMDAV